MMLCKADSGKAEIARLKVKLKAAKSELKTVTIECNEIQTITVEAKGELKAITAERDRLSGLNDKLTKKQTSFAAEYKVLEKQYSELSVNYNTEQGRVTALQADFEKAKIKLANA